MNTQPDVVDRRTFLIHGAAAAGAMTCFPRSVTADPFSLFRRASIPIRADYADDFASIDKQLNQVFDQCAIDPRRVAIGGFSDGATYALSVGLLNGDLFTNIIAHSPGFIIGGGAPQGKPRVFISHGRHDAILPIDQCGRRIAAQLQRDGYRVRFDEFDGGHTATPAMREAAFGWFAG